MAKIQKIYSCEKCGAQTPKWSGRCLECGAWGTLNEEIKETEKKPELKVSFDKKNLIDFNELSTESYKRLPLEMAEINQIFGGGIVLGSLTLIGGEPGIGKSTLVLQIFQDLEKINSPLLYISGEESANQIKLRLDRINYKAKNLKFLSETNVEKICAAIAEIKPAIAVIDSIQTINSNSTDSETGNIGQIRACTTQILETAKKNNIPILITGHVTKDGAVAGPKTLEHLVDTVIYLEGDKLLGYRLIRSTKNRFGATGEVGILEMTSQGLIEVKNPTTAFLNNQEEKNSGSVISCFNEGNRIFFSEIQALVSTTIFGYPQRKTSGYDINRLQMLSAVLFKKGKLNLNNQDIHLNIVGGFKIKEPSIDLAVTLAIYSSLKDKVIPKSTVVVGEVGLSGEVRPVQNVEKRIKEAEKLGFKEIIIPKCKVIGKYKIKITQISQINELMKI